MARRIALSVALIAGACTPGAAHDRGGDTVRSPGHKSQRAPVGSTADTADTVPATPPTTATPPAPASTVVEAARPPSSSVVKVRAPGDGAADQDVMACIRRHESGGDYRARNGHGHSGAYQFDRRTWASVGGSGEAADASPEEQDARAAELYRRRGLQPWSVRERCR